MIDAWTRHLFAVIAAHPEILIPIALIWAGISAVAVWWHRRTIPAEAMEIYADRLQEAQKKRRRGKK